jgi:hypothetical protein
MLMFLLRAFISSCSMGLCAIWVYISSSSSSLVYTPHLQRKYAGALRIGANGACGLLLCLHGTQITWLQRRGANLMS